jgi:hypothetical protein
MSYSTWVLIAGAAVIGAVLIAQWRLIQTRPEHFRTERLRGALYVAILFVSFSVMHWHLTEAEREPEQCCLTLFGEEVPPPGANPNVEPPPAPPPPTRPDGLSSRPSPPAPRDSREWTGARHR